MNAAKDSKKATEHGTTALKDHVTSRVLRHVDTAEVRRHVVEWFKYGQGDDTLKPNTTN